MAIRVHFYRSIAICLPLLCSFILVSATLPLAAQNAPTPLHPVDTILQSTTLSLAWSRGPVDSLYNVEVRGDSTFALSTTDSTATITLSIGAYEWRVRDSASEVVSDWSDWSPFSVRDPLPVPVSISPDGDSLTADDITFLWSTEWEGENELMISGDSTWSVLTGDTSLVAALDSGSYFWRVRSTADGVGGEWSDALSFVVLPVADLPVVSPLAPLNKTVGTGIVRLIWTADWRNQFEIQMKGDSTFTTSVTAYQHEVDLSKEGVYEWRIRTRDGVRRGPWTAWWRITTRADIVGVEETTRTAEKLDLE